MAHPKRVHFSESPLLYTYTPPATPRTPSPTWSDDSLPDNDSGPSTPPSTSSFPPRSLPSTNFDKTKQRVTASPIFFDVRTQRTPLVWNVTAPPTRASVRSVRKSIGKSKDTATALVPSDLSLPATNPATSTLEIHIPQLPPYWKPIQLRKNALYGSTSTTTVTVGDVLESVHRYMRTLVSQEEFNMFPKDMQSVVAKAYWGRYDAAANSGNAAEADAIKKGGIRRVDALQGNTQFVTLLPMNAEGDVWQVILAAPPRP